MSGLDRHARRQDLPARGLRRFALALLSWCFATASLAEDMPPYQLIFRDGAIEPLVTKVPANRRIKLILSNEGSSAVEFESIELRKEKVVAPKVTTFIVIRNLEPGEHVFFDDFHPDAPQARIIAETGEK